MTWFSKINENLEHSWLLNSLFKSHTTCCSCCTCCTLLYWQFPISSQRYWEYLIMVEREIWILFTVYIFKKFTAVPPLNCKIHGDSFYYLEKSSHHGWAAKKVFISRTSKTPVSSFWEYTFWKTKAKQKQSKVSSLQENTAL